MSAEDARKKSWSRSGFFPAAISKTVCRSFFVIGTDVLIFKIFSPKNKQKYLRSFDQASASFLHKFYHHIGF
jgi:hypothetical protein